MKNIYKIILLTVFNSVFLIFNSLSQTAPGIEWAKCYGGSLNDQANFSAELPDGNFIVAGRTSSYDGDVTITNNYQSIFICTDYWLLKLDTAGGIIWQKCYGGSESDYARDLKPTNDGGFIFAGYSNSDDVDVSGNNGGNSDSWVIKLDSIGNIQWQQCMGGSQQDISFTILQTSDNNYITSGSTNSNDSDVTGNHGGPDFWTVKLDTSGIILWQKCYGGSSTDVGNSIAVTSEGGYIMSGSSQSSDGDVSYNYGMRDCWIVKTDSIGNIHWQKNYGGSKMDDAYDIKQTTDGGYIFTGYTASNDSDVTNNYGNKDIWIVKLDTIGNILWQKCYGGTGNEEAYRIIQTPDAGYIISGYTQSNDSNVTGNHGYSDFWIFKVDSLGTLIWENCYGGSDVDNGFNITNTTDGGFILCGATESNDGDVTGNHDSTGNRSDFWVAKLGPDTITSITQLPNYPITISVFPNPVTGKLNVTVTNKELSEITLYDIASRKLFQKKFTNSISINTEQLAKGIYIYEVRDRNGLYKKGKVVKN